MFKIQVDIDKLSMEEKRCRENLFKNINPETAIRELIIARLELKSENIIYNEEVILLKEMLETLRKENKYYERAALLRLLSAVYRIHYKDEKQSLIYLREALEDVRYRDKNFSMFTEEDFGMGRTGILLLLKFLMKDLNEDYFPITNDMNLLDEKQKPKVML